MQEIGKDTEQGSQTACAGKDAESLCVNQAVLATPTKTCSNGIATCEIGSYICSLLTPLMTGNQSGTMY